MVSILHVEDDENDVFFLQNAFQQAGIVNPVHVVKDGLEAIEYLGGAGRYADREEFPLPCLVLLDLKLPGMHGLEVLDWIKQQPSLRRIVVIILTSSQQEQDVERAYELGVNSFLVKPAGIRERLEIANGIKTWWLRHNLFATGCEAVQQAA
jgi:CheY-like chemotaxis protein